MGRLISDALFAKVRVKFNDVQDTFYGKDVVYKADKNTVTRWNRDIELSRQYNDIPLKGLVVWKISDEDAEVMRTMLGGYDGNVAYVNVKFDEAQPKGLVDGMKNVAARPAKDKITIDGITYPVQGLIKLGQWWDTAVVLKILFRKDIVVKGG